MKKGISLPIEDIVIIALAVLVIVIIVAFFFNLLNTSLNTSLIDTANNANAAYSTVSALPQCVIIVSSNISDITTLAINKNGNLCGTAADGNSCSYSKDLLYNTCARLLQD